MSRQVTWQFAMPLRGAIIGAVFLWSCERSDSRPSVEEIGYQALTQIKDRDAAIRRAAVEKMGSLASADLPDNARCAIEDALVDAITDRDESVRRAAVRVVRWFPNESQAVLPQVQQYLQSSDREIRMQAAHSLAALVARSDDVPSSARLAVPILVESLRDPNWPDRRSTIEALGKLGDLGITTDEAVNALLVLARGREDDTFLCDALVAIGRIRQPFDRIGPVITAGLDDPDEHIRFCAVCATAYLGVHGEALLPRLAAIAESDERMISQGARQAIDSIKYKLALAALRGKALSGDGLVLGIVGIALKDPDQYSRQAAAYLLGGMGAQARQYLADLRNLSENDVDSGVQIAAMAAVYRIEMSIQGE